LISEGQSILDELDECCQSSGLVRQVIYAVMGECSTSGITSTICTP
jgi:hypothetical protein